MVVWWYGWLKENQEITWSTVYSLILMPWTIIMSLECEFCTCSVLFYTINVNSFVSVSFFHSVS